MAQNYPNIPPEKAVSDSREDILARDDALKSCFSGNAFPTADLVIGMWCRRLDQSKVYQLKTLDLTDPENPIAGWTLVFDLNKTAVFAEDVAVHTADQNNPHAVTAAQIGAATTAYAKKQAIIYG